jgi:DNA-binding transcriptional ArsR family regulator
MHEALQADAPEPPRPAYVGNLKLDRHLYFDYDQTMNVAQDAAASRIASAIGEPARARMLYCLMDGHARTSTELAVIAEVSPSTASVHLSRLRDERLVKVLVQGKHRYYSLAGADVADVLERLTVLAGGGRRVFVPNTPSRLRGARTCYDHIAGVLGVALHDRLVGMGWLAPKDDESYDITAKGAREFSKLGVDLEAAGRLRRRFAFPCLDWSERRAHLGGAMGAAVLGVALKRKWVVRDLDSRALRVTRTGRKEIVKQFGIEDGMIESD